MGKFLKGCLIALGGLMLLVLVVAGIAYYLLTRPSPAGRELLGPGATPTPTPPPQVIEERAQALETKLEAVAEQIQQAEKGTQPQTIRVEITEDEVNALIIREMPRLQQEMKDSPITITSAQVAFRDGKLKAVAQTEFSAFRPTIYLEARVELEAGKPKVIVEKLDMGRLPLPGAVRDQINSLVQDAIRQATERDIPMEIQRITIGEGKLVLEGVVIPESQRAVATPPPPTPTPATTPPPAATPTPTPVATPTPAPTSTPTPRAETREFRPEDVAFALTYAFTELLRKEGLTLQIGAVQVDLSRGRIDAVVPITALGQTFPVPLVANVGVSGGKALLLVERVDATALPPPLRAQVEDFIKRGAGGVALDVGFQVTSAVIQGGKVILQGLSPP